MAEHIKINDVTPRIQYAADGSKISFTYPFPIFTSADLEVYFGSQRQNSGFTINGAGNSTGGAVVFATAPAAGTRVTLRRRLAIKRISDFQEGGAFRAKVINDELDYQTAALQQVADDLALTVRQAPTSAAAADLTLPEPASGLYLKWRADGLGLENGTFAGAGTPVSQFMQGVLSYGSAVALRQGLALPELQSDGKLAASVIPTDATLLARIAVLEQNLAVATLRQQIDTGWSVLKMVDGVADEFEDESGVLLYWSADQCSGGTAISGGSYGSYVPSLAFDDNDNYNSLSFWASSVAVSQSSGAAYIGYQLPSAKAIRRILVTNGNSPASIKVQYSDNGTAWTDVVTYAPINANMVVDLPDVGAHAYWRLLSNSNSAYSVGSASSSWAVPEIQMLTIANVAGSTGQTYDTAGDYYHNPDKANMTLISQSFTAQSQPTEARFVLLHQPVDGVSVNSDCLLEVSRNGGTSWIAATLFDEGPFDGSANILTATADLGGQSAGTAMRWRFKSLNNKEQRLHGVWMQWR